MMRMKIENNILIVLLALFAGCAGVPRTNGNSSPSSVPDPVPPPLARPSQPEPVTPPRFERWLEAAKSDFNQAEAESGLYRYSVESVKSTDPMPTDLPDFLSRRFRHKVAESFASRTALDPRQVAVAILSEQIEPKSYRGEAMACGINDVSMAYDPLTRKGTLSMKIRNGDFEGTRKIIRQHIETIVRDKNIQLVTGVPPPPGQYYLLGESVKPGNVLEIKFKSE